MTAAYATQALICLSRRGGWVRGADVIASCSGVPRPYLVKLLHALARKGLVETKRGYRGGYRLARSPEEITLFEILAAVDGPDTFRRCLLGFGRCSPERGCSLHPTWSGQRARFEKRFRELTLREMASFERSEFERDYRFGLQGDSSEPLARSASRSAGARRATDRGARASKMAPRGIAES
jgi:Rrf2 family protein